MFKTELPVMIYTVTSIIHLNNLCHIDLQLYHPGCAPLPLLLSQREEKRCLGSSLQGLRDIDLEAGVAFHLSLAWRDATETLAEVRIVIICHSWIHPKFSSPRPQFLTLRWWGNPNKEFQVSFNEFQQTSQQ